MNALCAVLVLSSVRLALANPCPSGQTFGCPDGSRPGKAGGGSPCPTGKPQCCNGATCSDAPSPSGGGHQKGAPPTAKPCRNPTSCSKPPCAAALRGDVGCSTVAGVETYSHELLKKGDSIPKDAHIFGPFEAGFGVMQKSIIEGWGCSDATVVYDDAGGLDIDIAEKKAAYKCGIQLPRTVGTTYFGLVGPCGGHTSDYHFHVRLSCLYEASGAHSTAVGVSGQWNLYGKWEDFTNKKLPLLDACGGQFGVTPDSASKTVYHYHVQDKPPFTIGCHGPSASGGLVSVAACRKLYPKCSEAPESIKVSAAETVSYIRDCPCWDANGNNAGAITELPAMSSSAISVSAPAAPTTGVSATAETSEACQNIFSIVALLLVVGLLVS